MRLFGNRRGSTILEFTLVGIPMIFILIGTFEMARGMWLYHTMSYAIRDATRYASVHGVNCTKAPNSCTIYVSDLVSRIESHGIGLDPTQLNVTFTDVKASTPCAPLSTCASGSSGTSSTVQFPADGANAQGEPITITGTYTYKSALVALFWPGGGTVRFGAITLPATSRDYVQF